MDNLIKTLRKKPYSNDDILKICDNKTKIISYNTLYDYKDIDEVLHPFNNIVILYETRPNYGHWVCLIKHKHKNKIEFFDPYGLSPDEQLDFINSEFRVKNNEYYPILSDMLYNSKYKIVYNSTKLQKYSDNISSCGRHVALRIILSYLSLNNYVNLLKNNKYDPDTVVTYLTAFM